MMYMIILPLKFEIRYLVEFVFYSGRNRSKFCFFATCISTSLACLAKNNYEVNKKWQETMVITYLREQQEKRRKSEKC